MHWSRLVALLLLLAGAQGCRRSAPAPAATRRLDAAAVIATFEGKFDPSTRQLSIRTTPAAATPAGLVVFPAWSDEAPGSGPDDTIELVTEPTPQPGVIASGCGTVNSFDGAITIRSFFRDQAFSDVYVELTSVVPPTFSACNSDPAVTGVGATWGLWAYGPIGPKGSAAPPDHATRTWKFRFAESQEFTFQGRVMANLAAPVRRKGPELDWSASAIVVPASSFVTSPRNTRARVSWSGAAWIDAVGTLGFAATGTPGDTPVGLWSPARHRVGPFGAGTFFTGADTVGTSGDFTACVLFKPGAHPATDPDKVLLAKGNTATGEGWALLQRGTSYCFEYSVGGTRTAACAPDPSPTTPLGYTYDYVCGGRLGGEVRATAHGRTRSEPSPVAGDFGSPLPLALGAYPGGASPALDAALYEVILDRRGASFDVMDEIVGDAEGRKLFPGSGAYAPRYLAPFADGTPVIGADGLGYVAPPYATVPLPSDGSGLLPAGSAVRYTHPLGRDTRATGFCVAAEVVATGAWSAVSGGLLEVADGLLSLGTNPFSLDGATGTSPRDDWSVEAGWEPGSAHTFMACAEPLGFGTPRSHLYLDGVEVGAGAAVVAPLANLADPAATLVLGARGSAPAEPLTGARLRRVFAYPSPDPATMVAPFPTPRVAHVYVAMRAAGATAAAPVAGLGRAIVRWSRGGDAAPGAGSAQDGFDTRLSPLGLGASDVDNLPVDYVIEASAGAGYTALATVTGNTYITRAHVVDLTGYTSVRMRLTSAPRNAGSEFLMTDFDVHDARSGTDDWWLALGDSLTANVWNVADTIKYGSRIHGRDLRRFPVAHEGGVSGGYMSDFLWKGWTDATLNPAHVKPLFQQWVQDFEGRYVVIAVGQNDCNAGTSLDSMETMMRQMIQLVVDEGKIPVVPTLRWIFTNGAASVANIEAWNARLVAIRADYPTCTGPDVYTRSKVQGLDGLRPDRTHLNGAGLDLTQEDWDLWAMQTMY